MERAIQRAMERAGHQTLLFDDRRSARLIGRSLTQWRARRVARRFRPDFVFLSKCLRLDVDTVREIIAGKPNAMWYHDPQWHRDLDRWDVAHIANVGKAAQVFFVTGFVAEWRTHGLNAHFLPAAGASEICPVAPVPALACDAAFIGAGYDDTRAAFLRALTPHLSVRVFGPGWERWKEQLRWNGQTVEGRAFAAVCSSATYSLGILPERAAGSTTYASDRMWMTILAGGLYLGPRAPGIDRMLLDEEHCLWYDSPTQCIHTARRFLKDPVKREGIRRAGEAFVRQHHTYDARLPFLLQQRAWQNPLDT